ncbi:hypothetical protein BJ165DRAFT_415097 [Panaeolus papilionaceus]|nr:hypothetical protein BJ165DRAFT_415097 [Panaeolus papilionaceus]
MGWLSEKPVSFLSEICCIYPCVNHFRCQQSPHDYPLNPIFLSSSLSLFNECTPVSSLLHPIFSLLSFQYTRRPLLPLPLPTSSRLVLFSIASLHLHLPSLFSTFISNFHPTSLFIYRPLFPLCLLIHRSFLFTAPSIRSFLSYFLTHSRSATQTNRLSPSDVFQVSDSAATSSSPATPLHNASASPSSASTSTASPSTSPAAPCVSDLP